MWQQHSWIVAHFPEQAQAETLGAEPDFHIGSVLSPRGKAKKVAGGHVLNGRWPFASGCDHGTWIMLGATVVDEAGNMPLAWLPEVAATCAGIGILLVTIWQSKSQLDAAYGKLSDSVLTNHLTKIVFSGCSDEATLSYVTRLLGEEELLRRTTSYDVAGGNHCSVSENTIYEDLTPFHLLRQVRPGEAVLIHGTLPPAHLTARRWWEEQGKRPKK